MREMRQRTQPAILVCLATAFAALTPARAQDRTVMFRTPSNNIHCLALIEQDKTQPDGIVCDISNIAGKPLRPKPSDCEFDWGQRFALSARGGAGMECYSDWSGSDWSPILTYGSSLQIGTIVCTSTQQGLECRNAAGRGFFLSRNAQRIF
jgi:hypothetical protein